MTIFDLVFILVFLFTVGFIVRILYLLAGKRAKKAWRATELLGVLLAGYFVVLVAVSLVAPRKLIPMGEDRCFDDWCIGADTLTVSPTIGSGAGLARASGIFYIVTLKVSSQARGITQRAKEAAVIAVDERGSRYSPSSDGQAAYDAANGKGPAITSELGPGAFFTTTVVFDIPIQVAQLGLKVEHGVWPGRLIIGDSESFFHKSTLIMLSNR
jgi:hypothetical protein